jgi:hypothetical protein
VKSSGQWSKVVFGNWVDHSSEMRNRSILAIDGSLRALNQVKRLPLSGMSMRLRLEINYLNFSMPCQS